MKTKILIINFILTSLNMMAQDATGEWNGALKVGGMQLRLVFHVTKTDKGYSATMDSPDQGQKNIPMSKATFENKTLTIEMAAARISYTGTLVTTDSINGTFSQAGQNFPMNLTRKLIKKQEVKRPQEPLKPYPYYSEEVIFENTKENISLAGTLTLPTKEGRFPVVVLITGSGPQNRDEELMGHKPFLVITDYLTRNGIGVLRFDDRGCFASKGNFKTATTNDFAMDVESAVNYLKTRKEIDQNHIGLIGHSEGGIIAPIVASKNKDVSFIVLMAGTGVSGGDILLKQQEDIGRINGIEESSIKLTRDINKDVYQKISQISDTAKLSIELRTYLKSRIKDVPAKDIPKDMKEDDMLNAQLTATLNPWMLNFIRYNPASTLEKVKCSVLALNGDKDLQVCSKINLPAIEIALKKGGNTHYTIKELPGLNHLFQECKTGSPSEYAEIEQTVSPKTLETMTSWIKTICR
ncbi:MAG: acyl-CoA thioester hydrolase/BAAT C-terminal domain-containing protein [Paludibacter sp.]